MSGPTPPAGAFDQPHLGPLGRVRLGLPWALAVALVVALMPIVLLASPVHAATGPQTVVSLTFDDGNADQLPAAAILKAHGMTGTFFVNSGTLGMDGFFTKAQLDGLAADGNEIGGHTVNHPSLPTLPADEAKRQICLDRSNLLGLGYDVRSFAYPFAETTPAIDQLASDCGYNSARNLGDLQTRFGCAGCAYAETIPPAQPFETKALDEVDNTWTLQDFEDAVTHAEAQGGWVQFTFHNFCGTVCGELSVNQAIFTSFLDWLQTRSTTNNTVVKNVGDVIGGATKPAVAVAAPTPPTDPSGLSNPGFETLGTSTPVMPACWQQGGYGSNTAVSDTTTGRTGDRAGRLTVTDYVDGDAKIIPSLDLGTCSPAAKAGKAYTLKAWYTSTAETQFDVYLRTTSGSWIYWTSSPYFAAASAFTEASWTSMPIPAGYTGISYGLNLFNNGTLVVDDFSIAQVTVPATTATVAPAVPDGLLGWYTTQPVVTLSAVDADAVIEYSYDGGTTWTTYTTPLHVPDGTKVLTYRSTVDSIVETPKTIELKTDTVAPVVTPSFTKSSRSVTATATDDTSAVDRIEQRVDGGTWAALTGPLPIGDAAATVDLRAIDVAGNVSTVKTLNIPERQTPSTLDLALGTATTTYGKAVTATVTVPTPADNPVPTGHVTLKVDGVPVAVATLAGGTAAVQLPSTLPVAHHTVTAAYDGDRDTKPSTSAATMLTVGKARTSVSLKLSPSKATVHKTHVKVRVTVTVPGTTVKPVGRVYVLIDGSVVKSAYLTTARGGRRTITLPKFGSKGKVKISVVYGGSPNTKARTSSRKTLKIVS